MGASQEPHDVDCTDYTPEQYLERERSATYKSQYYRGEIFAMSGASREHNLVVANLLRTIGNQLLDRPCELYPSDMRVKVQDSGLYTYPDAVIVCGKPQFEDRHIDTLLNPLVLFEVLSESTEAYDRGAMSAQYRRLSPLRSWCLCLQQESTSSVSIVVTKTISGCSGKRPIGLRPSR